ncbi:hypothetical protein GCM10025868_44070 [Angustibacter aerolatus]|uniref:DHHA1 domain-containing protein n=1 Tax=Angustibacter aerolatus TaxID=1162965 RepID=A0ABQ6JLL1_9ACTN|nr:hypothetical protein [Angustibacter aerolatus]GMA89157.1 hypothetical protein GCM10025868_44070 [Angustibacter aerolatus]
MLEHENVESILATPDVAERVEPVPRAERACSSPSLRRCSTVRGDLVVVDLRTEDVIHAGNRFMVYALFPQCRVSVHVIWGKQQLNTVLAVGKSILDRTSPVDVGALMLEHGGGGHQAAGTCQVEHDQADAVLALVADRVNGVAAQQVV